MFDRFHNNSGSGTGRGRGSGKGQGRGQEQGRGLGGRNQRQGQESQSMGPSGRCICPKCGETTAHRAGVPCQERKCPSCGSKMLREGGYHHQLLRKKRNND